VASPEAIGEEQKEEGMKARERGRITNTEGDSGHEYGHEYTPPTNERVEPIECLGGKEQK
jgi:hypothetical protein